MSNNKIGREIRLYGRVQGVGFRYFTQRTANKIGVKGFVKNMRDGSVLINVYGAKTKIKKFKSKVKQGPVTANVNSFDIEEIPYNSDRNNFIVKY